jgi:branched-chain amino acid transport system substrate-binding protein
MDLHDLCAGPRYGQRGRQDGAKSWFILASDYAFGKQLAADTQSVVQASGGKVLGTIYHPLNTADFSSFLLQAQSSGADVIALANAGGDTINAIKQAGEFGIGTGKQNWPPCCSCSPTCTAWA